MTTAQKAEELINKYTLFIGTYEGGRECYLDNLEAKQCALIAVDEIIEVLKETCDEDMLTIHIIYWQKVKNEINKL